MWAGIAAPSARKPKAKESFFQKLYKGNWRNIVVAGTEVLSSELASSSHLPLVAGINAIRFAFS